MKLKSFQFISIISNYKFCLLVFVFFSNSAFSQNIICTYSVKVDSTYLIEKNFDVKEIYYNYINYIDDIKYKLKVSNLESVYEIDKEFTKKHAEKNVKFAQNVGGRGVYYSNFKDKVSLNQKEFFGDIYLIEQEMPVWNLTSDTKKIDGVECFKAYSVKKVDNGKRQFDKVTTVWYAPSFPYSFGPMNSNGLPGLVFELQENEVILHLTQIEFFDIEFKIDVPEKGIKMTESQYQRYLIENGENLLKNKFIKN